jgi:hypothetical protein
MSVLTLGSLRETKHLLELLLTSMRTSEENQMYNDLNEFERALSHFGTRVDVICAMEISGRISAETAYQNIKMELKELKKARKQEKK